MKPKLPSIVGAVLSLFVLSALPICSARPRSHLHHRNDRLPRIARATPIDSGSSLVDDGSDSLCGELLTCYKVKESH